MLYGLLVTLYIIVCLFLILIILIQKSKGSMGLGGLGGGSQMLFGGSGGQDIFQKITWGLGIFFVFGSLILALMKSYNQQPFRYIKPADAVEAQLPISSSPSQTQQIPDQKDVAPAATQTTSEA
jgi:preprotein translocase subunit SecG